MYETTNNQRGGRITPPSLLVFLFLNLLEIHMEKKQKEGKRVSEDTLKYLLSSRYNADRALLVELLVGEYNNDFSYEIAESSPQWHATVLESKDGQHSISLCLPTSNSEWTNLALRFILRLSKLFPYGSNVNWGTFKQNSTNNISYRVTISIEKAH